MTRPRWLALGAKEMAELRDLPAVQMIMEWLEWEREQAREMVLQAVSATSAPAPDARLRAGVVLAIDAIMRSLNTPLPIAEMSDDDFVDSAMRPSRRKDPDAQV